MKSHPSPSFACNIRLCDSMCCRNCPVLTENEVTDLIADVKNIYDLDIDRKKFFRPVKGEFGLYFAIKMMKNQCIFLNKEKRCRIYDCRPVLCQLYPVIDVDTVDERCPGIFQNEMLEELKKRYAQEIDEKIRKEHTFRFV